MDALGKIIFIALLLEISFSFAKYGSSKEVAHMDAFDWKCEQQLNYTIRNQLQAPKFEYSLAIQFCPQPFIRIMEKAADMDGHFKFSATYFSKVGYYIDAINGVRGFYNVNQTWWAFSKAPDTFLPGVSSYYPDNGDHIIFNFTQFAGR